MHIIYTLYIRWLNSYYNYKLTVFDCWSSFGIDQPNVRLFQRANNPIQLNFLTKQSSVWNGIGGWKGGKQSKTLEYTNMGKHKHQKQTIKSGMYITLWVSQDGWTIFVVLFGIVFAWLIKFKIKYFYKEFPIMTKMIWYKSFSEHRWICVI